MLDFRCSVADCLYVLCWARLGRYKITSQELGRGFMRISGFRRGHCRFREKKCDGTK